MKAVSAKYSFTINERIRTILQDLNIQLSKEKRLAGPLPIKYKVLAISIPDANAGWLLPVRKKAPGSCRPPVKDFIDQPHRFLFKSKGFSGRIRNIRAIGRKASLESIFSGRKPKSRFRNIAPCLCF
ncbi:MAG: hypothetical protein ACE5IY_08610 [bacterium]